MFTNYRCNFHEQISMKFDTLLDAITKKIVMLDQMVWEVFSMKQFCLHLGASGQSVWQWDLFILSGPPPPILTNGYEDNRLQTLWLRWADQHTHHHCFLLLALGLTPGLFVSLGGHMWLCCDALHLRRAEDDWQARRVFGWDSRDRS